MPRIASYRFISLAGLFFFCFSLFGQEKKETFKIPPKKIGLVLSGGGAKGYAHIGALKVIERLGLRLNYIAGTSAGALIGALYAAGYSAQELEKLVYDTNFIDVLFMEKNRANLPFFDKKYRERYLAEFSFDNFKVRLPQGLSRGQGMHELLSSLFFPVRHISDYSQLSIPFFCTATDLETGKLFLMKEGDLVQSVLASAAFPSLIAPIEIDGRLYIDGGVSVNMPVKQLKEQGVDFVIAVDVMKNPYKKEEINSMLRIVEQIASYGRSLDNIEQRKAADILIAPDVKQYSIVDFTAKEKIINEGEKAAMQSLESLEKLARVQKGEFNLPVNPSLVKERSIFVTSIFVDGLDKYEPAYVLSKMGIQLFKKTTYEKLRKGVEALYATGNFLNVNYKLVPSELGDSLIFTVRENPSNLLFKIGAHYSQPFKTGILFNLTSRELFFKNAFMSADLVLGDNPRGTFNYYVDNGWRPGWGYHFNYDQFESLTYLNSVEDVHPSGSSDYFKNHETTQRLYAQSILKDQYVASFGLEHKILLKNSRFFKGHKWRGVLWSAYTSLQADNADNINFPHKGFIFDGILKYSLLDHSFFNPDKNIIEQKIFKNQKNLSLEASLQMNFPFHRNWTLRLRSSLGLRSMFDKEYDFFTQLKYFYGVQNYLGGINQRRVFNNEHFYGYPFAYLYGMNKFLLGAELQYQIFNNHYISFLSNISNLEDQVKDLRLLRYKYSGFGISYGYDSIFGPLRLFWTYSPDKGLKEKNAIQVALGFWF